MSFKRGDVVKVIRSFDKNHPDWDTENIGLEAVVKGSYGELYGNGQCYGGYSIIFTDTGGSESWWDEEALEFVRNGSEELIDNLKKKYEEHIEHDSELPFIVKMWPNVSFASYLALFNMIDFHSLFHRTGEYVLLNDECNMFYPLLDAIFKGDRDTMMNEVPRVFKSEYISKFEKTCSKLFDKVQELKGGQDNVSGRV